MTTQYDKIVSSAFCDVDLLGHHLVEHLVLSVWREEKKSCEHQTIGDVGATKTAISGNSELNVMEVHSQLRMHFKQCDVLILSTLPNVALWARQKEVLPTNSLLHARYFLGDVNFVEIENYSDTQTIVENILTLYKHKLPEHVPAAFIANYALSLHIK